MADQDIYDIMPHKEIATLKKQVQDLKSKKADSPELTKSMNALTQSMDSMLHLFTEAAEELKLEGKEESDLAKKLDPLNRKLNEIMEQNKTIAEGIIAVSDLIKDYMAQQKKAEKQEPRPRFQQSFQSPPSLNQQPFPEMPHPEPASGVPFPEVEEQPKKGIFGRLKK